MEFKSIAMIEPQLLRKEASKEIDRSEDWDAFVGAEREQVWIAGDEEIDLTRDGRGQKVVVVRVLFDDSRRLSRRQEF